MRHTRKVKTLSIKVPVALSARVVRLAKSRRTTVSSVVRDALEAWDGLKGQSFADAAAEFIGSVRGPADLSTNKRYLKGLGR